MGVLAKKMGVRKFGLHKTRTVINKKTDIEARSEIEGLGVGDIMIIIGTYDITFQARSGFERKEKKR